MDILGVPGVGNVSVTVRNYRGMSAEELADDAMKAILDVRGNPPEIIRQQLVAFQNRLRDVLVDFFKKAQAEERNNIYGALIRHGAADVAKIIRDM